MITTSKRVLRATGFTIYVLLCLAIHLQSVFRQRVPNPHDKPAGEASQHMFKQASKSHALRSNRESIETGLPSTMFDFTPSPNWLRLNEARIKRLVSFIDVLYSSKRFIVFRESFVVKFDSTFTESNAGNEVNIAQLVLGPEFAYSGPQVQVHNRYRNAQNLFNHRNKSLHRPPLGNLQL